MDGLLCKLLKKSLLAVHTDVRTLRERKEEKRETRESYYCKICFLQSHPVQVAHNFLNENSSEKVTCTYIQLRERERNFYSMHIFTDFGKIFTTLFSEIFYCGASLRKRPCMPYVRFNGRIDRSSHYFPSNLTTYSEFIHASIHFSWRQ